MSLQPFFEKSKNGGIFIKNIQVTNLSENAVSDMISDFLQMPKSEIESLVELVWDHTKGNVVFIMYFLRSLVDQGVLQQETSTSSRRWTWNRSKVDYHEFGEDVVSLLAGTMFHLDYAVQEKLKVAACLGAEFTKKTLQHAMADPSASSVDSFLTTTTELGLMLYDSRSGTIGFVHDRVQQAAYSLIPEEGLASFHFDLGMTLWKSVPADRVVEWVFSITSQLSKAVHLVEDQREKYRLAALFLRAGEKAVLSSAFATAATYIGQAIQLLGAEGSWKDEYYLSLALYDSGAEIAYCVGDFEMVDHCVEQVLQNATKSFRDKLRAVSTQVYALGARDRLDEAINVALDVLRLLGEPFPQSVSNATLAIETIRTKWVLRGKSDERILRLPKMTDPDKSAAMKMLNLAFLHAYQARPEYAPLIALRQVRLTIKCGLSPISACGFATYGMILCVMGDASQGYRYGQLALKIHEQFGATEYLPRIYAGVFGCIHHWTRPLRDALDYVEKASKMGFLTGDIEYGTLEANVYCVNALDAGCPLVEVENRLRHNCTIMSSYNQDTELGFARILLQGVLNLKGQALDPLELTGEVLEESEAIKEMASRGNVTFLCFIYMMKLWAAYILGYYEQAERLAILSRNVDKVVFCAFDSCVQCFFDGMTALALAQEGRREGDIRVARNCLKRMTHWAKNCPSNCLHKRYLLEAEFAVLRNKHALAIEKFTSGIVLAREQDFLHEQAIGHERLGRHLLRIGDKATGESELHKAVRVFEAWGAKGKVIIMKKEFQFLA
jgi:predicted ATPase